MTSDLRHKYVVVLGSCCTADAIRAKNFEDIRGAKLRLLWYQARTSILSMTSGGLNVNEYTYKNIYDAGRGDWGLTMVKDELEKRQPGRLMEVIGMSDALVIDIVSAFNFPYLIVEPNNRYFLLSEEWERHVQLLGDCQQKMLWDIPIQRSVNALLKVLEPLYGRQPDLRLIFHLPRPCFNDGVEFMSPLLAANVNYYYQYGERLWYEASRNFSQVSVVSCGGERADPFHYSGPNPFHYDENYMCTLQKELERLLE